MKQKRVYREILIDLAVALAVILGVFVVGYNYHDAGMKALAPAINPFFVLTPQSVTETVIPDYAGVQRTYTFDMSQAPGNNGRGRSLYVYLRHTAARLEMDGKVYADTGEADVWHIGRTPGNYWLTLPIYADYGEKVIHLTLTPVYDSVRNEEPTFLLIDRQPLLHMLVLPQENLLLILSIVAAVLGLFLILLSLSLGLNGTDRRRVFYLGATALAAGVWKLCGLSAMPLLLDFHGRQKAIWFAGVVGYLLIMVFSLRLLTAVRRSGDGRIGKVCCCFATGLAALLLLLQIAGVVELHNVVVWYGIGMALLHLLALLGQKPSRAELLWLLPSFAALGIDVLYYLKRGTIATAPAFLIWIVLNLFVRGFGFLREAIRHEGELRSKQAELRAARVQSMISEIRPHFIHNTLTSIYMLCEEDPKRAQEVVGDFTTYLQANFSAISSAELTTFAKELEHTKAYVAVESVLYEGKLTVEYDTAFTAFRLPALTLQPIVENSIKHGVGTGRPHGQIMIRSRACEGGAEIVVEDDGPGFAQQVEDAEGHVGLQNVRERLEMMCGGTLEITPRPGGGTVVTVQIPVANSMEKKTERRI